MRENPPATGNTKSASTGDGLVAADPVIPIGSKPGGATSVSESANRPPVGGDASRVDGSYCLVSDKSGGHAASTRVSNSADQEPPSSTPISEAGPSGESPRWSLVPSPVIDVGDLGRGAARPARPHSATVSGLQPLTLPTSDIPEPKPQQPTPQNTFPSAAPVEEVKPTRDAAADFPVFDPTRAYPNAPAARPFVVGSNPPKMVTEVPSANAWLFLIGMLVFPAIGAGWAWAIRFVRLPLWGWGVVGACVLVGMVSSAVLLHRAWTCINDGMARTTPARAVGLMFIPVFNIYWIFNVVPGFATDYNRFIERHQIEVPPVSKNLLLAALVPVFGLLFYWPAISAICRAINAIRRVLTSKSKSSD